MQSVDRYSDYLLWVPPLVLTSIIVHAVWVGRFNLRGNYVHSDSRPVAFAIILIVFACIDALVIWIAYDSTWPRAFF